jgi:hypothetical protein
MSRRLWLALALAVLLAVALLLRRRVTHEGRTPSPEPGTSQRRQTTSGAFPATDARRTPVRTMVPRLTALPSLETGPDAQRAAPPRLQTGSGDLTDKRPHPTGDPKLLMAKLKERIKVADENAQRCLEAWAERDPALEKGVMLAFTIDAQGLQEVWIEDHPEVPSGALACLSNAVYPLDWGGLTTEPLMVTRKLRYARDAAP